MLVLCSFLSLLPLALAHIASAPCGLSILQKCTITSNAPATNSILYNIRPAVNNLGYTARHIAPDPATEQWQKKQRTPVLIETP